MCGLVEMTGLRFGDLAEMSRLKEEAHAAFCYIYVTDVCVHGNMSAGAHSCSYSGEWGICLFFHVLCMHGATFTFVLCSFILLKFLKQTFVTFVYTKI